MIVLTDDPSPMVRMALAESVADAADAPQTILIALLADQPDIAAIVAGRSPALLDAELVDLVGQGCPQVQFAIACRQRLPVSVAAAIVEVGCLEACHALICLDTVVLPRFSLARLVERHGADPEIREALFAREDLPAGARQALVAETAKALARFVSADRAWLPAERAQRVARESTEKATIALAARGDEARLADLVRHLRHSGQLTAAFVLRALLSGQNRLFDAALAELSGLPIARVAGLVQDRRRTGFKALYDEAGLPASAYPAFAAALDAWLETRSEGRRSGEASLSRRMVERVLTAYAPFAESDLDQLLALLRRFAMEAARDEARAFASDLVAGALALDDDRAGPLAA